MGRVKLLKASAGSGKTYRLAYEYVRTVVAEPQMYRHILAVTFTNKATDEMKSRILEEINALACGRDTGYMEMLVRDLSRDKASIISAASEALSNILHDYSRFSVLTIDKFFQRIIRSFVKELGIDLNFNLELRTDTLLSSAADALIDEISVNDKLRRWIADFVQERIEENKKWDIRSGLTQLGSEIFSETYKRSSSLMAARDQLGQIVSQYASRAHAARQALMKKAAGALSLMQSNGLDVSDFPYGRGGFANYFAKIATGVFEQPGKRVEDALASDEKWYSKTSLRKDAIMACIPTLRPILEEICAGYETNAAMFNTEELLRENFRNFALLGDLARKIEEQCSGEGVLPISETNQIINKLVSGNDAPFIFEKAGTHFSRFMIDEFQDTSTMQWENFIPLLRNSLSQSPGDPVLLVGDVKQSIYRWRGGDWRILANEIEAEFGDVVSEDMVVNFRSFGNVVMFNNEMIGACVAADNEMLNAGLDEALRQECISTSQAGKLKDMLKNAYSNHSQQVPKDHDKGYVTVTCYNRDEQGNATPPVIARVEELQRRGYKASDIAILVRYNAEGVGIANMLLEHKKNNPQSPYTYDVITQEALLIASAPVVSFVCACMKLAFDPQEKLSRAVFNKWQGRLFDQPLSEIECADMMQMRTMSPLEAFEQIVLHYRLGDDSEQTAYLQAFHDQMIEFTNSTIADIHLFLKWWDENGSGISVNVPESGSAITIISIHKSKGLQYKAVLIPYCNWRLSPDSRTLLWSRTSGELADAGVFPVKFKEKMRRSEFSEGYFDELVLSHVENINTLYVALTRAREELHIMLPDPAKKSADRVSDLIGSSISVSDSGVRLGSMNGERCFTSYGNILEFGSPVDASIANIGAVGAKQIVRVPFASYSISGRLKIKYSISRYVEDGANLALAPRDFGILMHKIFESSQNRSDITIAIEKLVHSGELTPSEVVELETKIATAFENPVVDSWFSDDWEVVRNENTIIVPGGELTRRPDRVMVGNGRMVVVDYKFGLNRPHAHARQMQSYMELLRAMGHTDVEGYLWYVSTGAIEQIML